MKPERDRAAAHAVPTQIRLGRELTDFVEPHTERGVGRLRDLKEGRAKGPNMEDRHWIEVFKDRITEFSKEVLQEDMDWTTSLPILERLNRLREVEAMRARGVRVIDPWVRISTSNK